MIWTKMQVQLQVQVQQVRVRQLGPKQGYSMLKYYVLGDAFSFGQGRKEKMATHRLCTEYSGTR